MHVGDLFDTFNTDEGLAFVLADVSGKGVSAALLANTLQGMIYSQLSAGMPLIELPELTEPGGDGVDLGGVYELAEALRRQGVR